MTPTANPKTITAAIQHLRENDARLATVIDTYGPVSVTPHKNYYQELVESIISQQLSVKAAATILKRFVSLFPDTDFPDPAAILSKDIEVFR